MNVERFLEKNKKLIAVLAVAVLFLYLWNSGLLGLEIVPGPEGVDCSMYSAVANGGIRVEGVTRTLTNNVGAQSVIGKVYPNSWIAYADYSDYDWLGAEYKRRIGYQWVRPDEKTPVIQAVLVDRTTGQVLSGVNIQVRISRPTMQDINTHGDPLGRSPTQIDWYSYETQKSQNGNKITWKHYEVYVVPVDFVIELSVRPVQDLNVGDFQNLDLWFVIDTVVWLNAFSSDQYALLKENPPEGVTISAYNFRGGFPIWAWVGAWQPWQVSGRGNNPNTLYDPADLSAEERSELEQHLQLMPSYGGSEVTLYTQPGYTYNRVFAADIIKNPDLLKQMLANMIPGLPDPRFAQTVYFPMTLINYGALKREEGWWITYKHWEYYPTSYMRVRVLYSIYGEWVYTWTQSEADKQGYQWENRSSIVTGSQSTWDKFVSGLGGFFTSPWTLLWTGIFAFFGILIVLVVLAIFTPWLLSALDSIFRKHKE
jgi:hypothetical protein